MGDINQDPNPEMAINVTIVIRKGILEKIVLKGKRRWPKNELRRVMPP